MRIGELADRLGVTTKSIRFYESIGLLPDPARTASGYRDYAEADAERLTFIKTAQRLGLSLDEIREIMRKTFPEPRRVFQLAQQHFLVNRFTGGHVGPMTFRGQPAWQIFD